MMEKNRRLSWLIFVTALTAFGYFQSGGGWNQNARFAMVRALVERGELTIDSYLIYVRAKPGQSTELHRILVKDGGYEIEGEQRLLMWPSNSGQFVPVNNRLETTVAAIDRSTKTLQIEDAHKVRIPMPFSGATEIRQGNAAISLDELSEGNPVEIVFGLDKGARVEAKLIKLLEPRRQRAVVFKDLGPVAATADVAFYRGHFYPNKAPGTSFAATPAYWFIFHFEKIIGANPDEWWTLTLNAWLTSLLSVGIISALGVLLFFQLACEFSNRSWRTSLIATGIFALGTMFFPNATLLYEHNIIAVALLGSFYLLYCVRLRHSLSRDRNRLTKQAATRVFLAGLCAGWAAITNYIFVVVVLLLAAYLVFSIRRKIALLWFALGLLGPFLLVCTYNLICFDTVFTTNYHYQNPTFEAGATHFLGVFNLPQWNVLMVLLFSPFRGLFFTAPVLIMSILGLFVWIRAGRFRAEAFLILGIVGFCLLWNASFNGWDGGVTAVPRYLGPMIPFLALAMLHPLSRFFKTTCGLAAISAAIMFLITAVDPQPPIGTGAAVVLDKPQWQYNPFAEYDLPIFLTLKPLPLLRQQEEQVLHYYDLQLARNGLTQSARNEELNRIRAEIDQKIAANEPAPLLLARVKKDSEEQYLVADSELTISTGPVSAHTFGFYGNWTDDGFGRPGSRETRWNSFNIGETSFPESRWSLLPFLMIMGLAVWRMALMAREVRPNAGA